MLTDEPITDLDNGANMVATVQVRMFHLVLWRDPEPKEESDGEA